MFIYDFFLNIFLFILALLGKEKKSNVSFGTTAHRPLFPASLPVNRIGNGMALDTKPNRGPGSYDNAEVIIFDQLYVTYIEWLR